MQKQTNQQKTHQGLRRAQLLFYLSYLRSFCLPESLKKKKRKKGCFHCFYYLLHLCKAGVRCQVFPFQHSHYTRIKQGACLREGLLASPWFLILVTVFFQSLSIYLFLSSILCKVSRQWFKLNFGFKLLTQMIWKK